QYNHVPPARFRRGSRGSRAGNPDVLDALTPLAPRTAAEGPWRSGAFAALARHDVLAGFVPADAGGRGATEPDLVAGLAAIAERCLTTALALSQWAAAVRIIAAGPAATRRRLPALARGDELTTVGISQLTTSRQHAATPALTATPDGTTWRLDGLCPWVTGADSVDTIVSGAATPDGGRLFCVVPTAAAGLAIDPPLAMLALDGSRTSAVRFHGVRAAEAFPAGPDGPRTGGLATTALAVGATRAALALVHAEAAARPALAPIAAGLGAEAEGLAARLEAAAARGIDPADRDRLRADANGLVVRAAQAALTAAKGAGFVRGHPAERLARESLFFLVWSCPQSVTGAVLCELAGLE
ncbi:MAG: acyl-CoA dehydrogenase, partial [Planctomycetaceae bacterium]